MTLPDGVELDHIVLVVADVERTLTWYQEHVRLATVRVDQWRAGTAPFPSLRVSDGTIIDVIPGHDGQRGHLDHICFSVSDTHAAEARASLVVIEEGQRFGARGVASSIYVLDPDGLSVEFRVYPPTPAETGRGSADPQVDQEIDHGRGWARMR